MNLPLALITGRFVTLLHYVGASAANRWVAAGTLALLFVPVARSERCSRRIPDAVIVAILALAAVGSTARAAVAVGIAAAVGMGLPLVVRSVTHGGMGWGDAKLCFALLLLLGVGRGLVGLLVASALALASWCSSRGSEAGIAFGPYLMAGAICALAWR